MLIKHNKDLLSVTGLLLLCLLGFSTMALIIKMSQGDLNQKYPHYTKEQKELHGRTAATVFLDLLGPTVAFVLYPTTAILKNRRDMMRHVKNTLC